jgi:hypothetical protein
MSIDIAIAEPTGFDADVPEARIAIQATGSVRFHVTGSAPTWSTSLSASRLPPAVVVWSDLGAVSL